MKKNLEIKFVLSLIFAILVAIFAIQNAVAVEINFLFARFTISQALIILISAIVGAIVVLLISLMNQISQRKKNKELTREVERLNEEIESMGKLIDGFNQGGEIVNNYEENNQESQVLNKNKNKVNSNYQAGETLTDSENDKFENQLNEYLSTEGNLNKNGEDQEDEIN